MILVIAQIRSGMKVMKAWHGTMVPEQQTLSDLYQSFASGALDSSSALHDNYFNTNIACAVGKTKQDLVSMSCSVAVGVAVSTLGPFVEFTVSQEETVPPLSSEAEVENAATILTITIQLQLQYSYNALINFI